MTEDERKIAEAFKKCAEARLPDDFADRLVRRIREKETTKGKAESAKVAFARLVLVAASVTLLLGFVPIVFERTDGAGTAEARCDQIRPANHALPHENQLDGLAFLGFCRELIRRRTKPLVERFRKREDED